MNGDPGNPWGRRHRGGGGGNSSGGGNRRPPNLEDIFSQGRDNLRGIFGGGRGIGRGGLLLIFAVILIAWLNASLYRVNTEEKAVVLTLGKYTATEDDGLHVALWPIQTYEVIKVTRENSINIGFGTSVSSDALDSQSLNDSSRSFFSRRSRSAREDSLMLTGDENIVDINFQIVWNISDPAKFLFNLAEPEQTIKVVAESAMREVIGRSELKPILNRNYAEITGEVQEIVQRTLNEYNSGVHIARVNFARADPPNEVIDAFRDVQAAEQDRDTLEKRAGADANKKLAEARGQAAEIMQRAEAYRAQAVKEAEGDAARFNSVYDEYRNAPHVTRKRLYLETMEQVLGSLDKIIIDDLGKAGVVPYLPLDQLKRKADQ